MVLQRLKGLRQERERGPGIARARRARGRARRERLPPHPPRRGVRPRGRGARAASLLLRKK